MRRRARDLGQPISGMRQARETIGPLFPNPRHAKSKIASLLWPRTSWHPLQPPSPPTFRPSRLSFPQLPICHRRALSPLALAFAGSRPHRPQHCRARPHPHSLPKPHLSCVRGVRSRCAQIIARHSHRRWSRLLYRRRLHPLSNPVLRLRSWVLPLSTRMHPRVARPMRVACRSWGWMDNRTRRRRCLQVECRISGQILRHRPAASLACSAGEGPARAMSLRDINGRG